MRYSRDNRETYKNSEGSEVIRGISLKSFLSDEVVLYEDYHNSEKKTGNIKNL